MVADCGATIAKYLLCVFNFVFFVVGASVLAVGIWLAADKNSFIQITKLSSLPLNDDAKNVIKEFSEPSVIEQAAYILIAAGAFIFIISFLGYCGAIKESRVLLTTYGVFLIIILCLQITAIVLAVVYKNEADEHTRGILRTSITQYYGSHTNRNAVTLSWDLVMSQMECCGVNNYTDFKEAGLFLEGNRQEGINRQVPAACCILEPNSPVGVYRPADDRCEVNPTTSNSYLYKGCFNKFTTYVTENLNIVIGTAVGIGAVQLLAIIFAFCVCKAVGAERDFSYKY